LTKGIVEVLDLWHTYRNGTTALRGVTLSIRKGDYIALIGKNGSGKSTLVKHFNGLLRPTKGTVKVAGLDTTSTRSERLAAIVGYVFQNPDHMLFSTTVEGEVEFGPKNLGLSPSEIHSRVEEALEVTGLQRYRKESPLFFGKGMRRMITIAAILAMRPEVLVIDEPTTGMDYRGRQSVMALIDELHASGRTIIIITHDMKIVSDYAERVLVMSEGRLLLDAPPEELFARKDVLESSSLTPPQRIELAQGLSLGLSGIPTLGEVTEGIKRYFKSREEPKPEP
jgi:cobalt transport protein ATP-binding subunit